MVHITIQEQENVWFPGIYRGREGDYAQKIANVGVPRTVELVKQRVKEDGTWAIENSFVGGNEIKMRKMMIWASDERNIEQCVEHVRKEGLATERTVDWVCRELATAARAIFGA